MLMKHSKANAKFQKAFHTYLVGFQVYLEEIRC